MTKHSFSFICLLTALGYTPSFAKEDKVSPTLVEVRKIWDKAPHNAFTDLVRFKDEWFCVFREGKGHVSPDGALRVIASKNGKDWRSTALLTSDNSDLRDAKINVTPDGRLMLSGAEAMHDRAKYSHQSLTWFSKDGRKWSKSHEVGDRDFWLWRTTWHKGKTYGFGYGTNRRNRSIRLYQSDNGSSFEVLVKNAFDKGHPNETSIVFLPDETALCLLRRDNLPNTAQLGRSKPPYLELIWKDLGVRIGGPELIRLPDGRFVTAVRRYDGIVRTSLHWLDPEKATLTEFMKLPSGKDTSYAGLVWHEDMLWVSYYSSHEGKTSIYLAKVKFGN
ncbi:glycoside hydrolase [Opitutales bacterium]|nr:glycoside hydrolase [Opitutales bacterium]